jgi:Uncharacterized protein conserved in archaea (DUF2150).
VNEKLRYYKAKLVIVNALKQEYSRNKKHIGEIMPTPIIMVETLAPKYKKKWRKMKFMGYESLGFKELKTGIPLKLLLGKEQSRWSDAYWFNFNDAIGFFIEKELAQEQDYIFMEEYIADDRVEEEIVKLVKKAREMEKKIEPALDKINELGIGVILARIEKEKKIKEMINHGLSVDKLENIEEIVFVKASETNISVQIEYGRDGHHKKVKIHTISNHQFDFFEQLDLLANLFSATITVNQIGFDQELKPRIHLKAIPDSITEGEKVDNHRIFNFCYKALTGREIGTPSFIDGEMKKFDARQKAQGF